MIFGILILLFVLGIGFIHFVQGLFSATLSAICAVLAAAVALGYHENVVYMFKGKLGDSSTAFALCGLFAVTYVVLRMICDNLVSGNVRFLSGVDKAGGAIMGVVAGLFAAGILAIAAQTMPFGASVFGYSRYALVDPPRKDFSISPDPNVRSVQRDVIDEMKSPAFDDKDVKTLLLPADDMVLGLFNTLSDGSLSGTRTFDSVHQNYLREAFGLRAGMEIPARRTTFNIGDLTTVTVDGVSYRDRLKQVEDAELPDVRGKKEVKKPVDPNADSTPHDEAKLAKDELKASTVNGKPQVILIVRALFDSKAFDEKSEYFRFTPGSIRLVTHGENGKAKDYYPLGTMDNWGGGTLWPNHVDDPLFAAGGADLVFLVDDRDEVLEGAADLSKKPKAGDAKPAVTAQVKPGVFLEVKRLARVDLTGMSAAPGPLPANPAVEVLRKSRLKIPPKKEG